jgi:hypothetical protein
MMMKPIILVGLALFVAATAFALATAARAQQIETTIAPALIQPQNVSDDCSSGIPSFQEPKTRHARPATTRISRTRTAATCREAPAPSASDRYASTFRGNGYPW